MRYANASEINALDKLRAVLQNDNEISAVAVIGNNELLSGLWERSDCGVPEKASDLFITCVDYGFIRHTDNDHSLVNVRNTAVWELFRQWTNAGLNKSRAKTPFSSKAFKEFIDIDKYCSETMYVVFQKESAK